MKKRPDWIWLLIAVVGGIFAGWVDFNNDEPQAAMLVILVVTFLLGLARPPRAWLWAVTVALCLPGVYLVLRTLGYQSVGPPSPNWYASLLILIPAFISAYAGALALAIINAFIKPIGDDRSKAL